MCLDQDRNKALDKEIAFLDSAHLSIKHSNKEKHRRRSIKNPPMLESATESGKKKIMCTYL